MSSIMSRFLITISLFVFQLSISLCQGQALKKNHPPAGCLTTIYSFFEKNSVRVSPVGMSNSRALEQQFFRSRDLVIISSKPYARFEVVNTNCPISQVYGLEILLNKYQVLPLTKPFLLRSTSLFYLIPHFRSNLRLEENGAVELECQTGLKMATNRQVESIVEDIVPRKINWFGKIALKWNLIRKRSALRSL
jgi:hypothetical protein